MRDHLCETSRYGCGGGYCGDGYGGEGGAPAVAAYSNAPPVGHMGHMATTRPSMATTASAGAAPTAGAPTAASVPGGATAAGAAAMAAAAAARGLMYRDQTRCFRNPIDRCCLGNGSILIKVGGWRILVRILVKMCPLSWVCPRWHSWGVATWVNQAY
mmetsp:Transcript_20592/g.44512  ORF Transcript_20592/g.44512 Transcript_20592/m.44512 type:complete len:158 (+) Transcript_20592:128-601(+)